ncbi:ABC transporter ATP-binding protein [Candidatus Saccharibacteria bacterium]|jgi:putative ABC transport system ATP-binding protein|nr:ABC transporter ATP-binding protein [Candidatus Saccharibacteria bacterium]
MALIELKDVSKLYGFGDATNVALDEVTLTIEKGECVAVMGPSGCGKSTLMNVIGLLDHPSHGDYYLNGRRSARLGSSQRAKLRRDKIGFIFQSFNLLGRLTAIDNVALPLLYKGKSPLARHKIARAMLERVGLHDRTYYYPHQLSGGQTQCVAIARALVNDPEIIIADEPTGNLDTESSRLVMELLAEIHKSGNTVLFVTHNPELTRYATRVMYMQDGMIKHDEQKPLGVVGRYAHTVIYGEPESHEDDDIAGVSALMKARERNEPAEKPARKTTKRRKTTKKRGGTK